MSVVPQEYIDFFLGGRASLICYECIEISHPAFSRVYRVVRNATDGLTMRHEDGQEYTYEYYPLKVVKLKNSDDLESGFRISLGDTGTILPVEVRRVMAADASGDKPQVIYRAYRSDNLNKPMLGPFYTEIKTAPYNKEGSTFESRARSMGTHGTGEVYLIERNGRWAPLRAFT